MDTNKRLLTNENINDIDAFVGRVLDAYKSEEITRQKAIGVIGEVVAGIDRREETVAKHLPKIWRPNQ